MVSAVIAFAEAAADDNMVGFMGYQGEIGANVVSGSVTNAWFWGKAHCIP